MAQRLVALERDGLVAETTVISNRRGRRALKRRQRELGRLRRAGAPIFTHTEGPRHG